MSNHLLGRNFLLLASYSGSVVSFRGNLLRAIRNRGLQVAIAVPDQVSNLRSALEGARLEKVQLSRNGLNPFADLRYLINLFFIFRRVRPEYVLAYTMKPVIYGLLSAWVARVPYRFALITGGGYIFTANRRPVLEWIAIRLYRMSLKRAAKVFFQNQDDETLFRQLKLLPSSVPSIVVNGSGVDLSVFEVAPISLGTIDFLMIGRLLGDKGVREYEQAARKIKIRYPQVIFRLVGWIDTNPDAIRQVELDAWVAAGTLEFVGKIEDVRPIIAASTVYVLPSYREGTPRTVLEAMAMGRPIITTDAPGCRETVLDGENGFLVPVKSVDALVDAMLKFIEDPMLAPRMGKRSREIAEQKYDVHKVNAVMLREMGITPTGEGSHA